MTSRKLSRYVDPRLEDRERLIREWEECPPKLARAIKDVIRDVEVYLVSSIAGREVHKAGDVDLLIATKAG